MEGAGCFELGQQRGALRGDAGGPALGDVPALGVVAVEVANYSSIMWFTDLQVGLGYPMPARHILGRYVVGELDGASRERALAARPCSRLDRCFRGEDSCADVLEPSRDGSGGAPTSAPLASVVREHRDGGTACPAAVLVLCRGRRRLGRRQTCCRLRIEAIGLCAGKWESQGRAASSAGDWRHVVGDSELGVGLFQPALRIVVPRC
mmetsp:Transcript_64185/g.130431  ORF Transcript_64185/g.130431 Transcript_64185/m.130431 type:complete len:207 (+) Transcript_64185:651-1271(+)